MGAEHEGFLARRALSLEPRERRCEPAESDFLGVWISGASSSSLSFWTKSSRTHLASARTHRMRCAGDRLDVLLGTARGKDVGGCIGR